MKCNIKSDQVKKSNVANELNFILHLHNRREKTAIMLCIADRELKYLEIERPKKASQTRIDHGFPKHSFCAARVLE